MAQTSRPQAGNVVTFATYEDSGPYTADQWARMKSVELTTDQQTTQGPLLGAYKELAVTFGTGTLNVYINTGAGICNGHFFENTTSATIEVTPPDGGSRTDYVCMVENNTGAALDAGVTFDTEGGAAIPPYSCRLAVVWNGPITQTNALWMVKLAELNTQAAPAPQLGYIGSAKDERVFCQYATDLQDNVVTTNKILNLAVTTAKIDDDAVGPAKIPNRTRKFFIQAVRGQNLTDLTDIFPIPDGLLFEPDKHSWGSGIGVVPSDYASGLSIQAVVVKANTNTGNVYSRNYCTYEACGESNTTHSSDSGYAATLLSGGIWTVNCVQSISIALASAGDFLHCTWFRNGVPTADTLTLGVYHAGFLCTYTADS